MKSFFKNCKPPSIIESSTLLIKNLPLGRSSTIKPTSNPFVLKKTPYIAIEEANESLRPDLEDSDQEEEKSHFLKVENDLKEAAELY
jgi:hypothetical protein